MKFAMKLKENEVWFKSRPLAHEVDMLIKLRGSMCTVPLKKKLKKILSSFSFWTDIYFPELFAYGRYSDGKTNYEAYVMESLLASVERAYSNNRNNIAVPLSTEVVSSILLLMVRIPNYKSRWKTMLIVRFDHFRRRPFKPCTSIT